MHFFSGIPTMQMPHTFHQHSQEGNQPQRQGVQGHRKGRGQNGTHRICLLHTAVLSLALHLRVGWSFPTGRLSQPSNVNVRKRRKEALTNVNYAKKIIGACYMSKKQLFQIWWASQVEIFLSLHKNELVAAIRLWLHEHGPCCCCRFASWGEGTEGKKTMVLLALKHCGQQLCQVESCETQPAWHNGT